MAFPKTPFPVRNKALKVDLFDIIAREGRLHYASGLYPGSSLFGAEQTITAKTFTLLAPTISVPAGRVWVVNKISIALNKDAIVQYAVSKNHYSITFGSQANYYKIEMGYLPVGGGTHVFQFAPMPMVLHEYDSITLNYARPDTAGAVGSYSIEFIDITNDLYLDAETVVGVVGDSITHTSAGGLVKGSEYWAGKLIRTLRNGGKSCRLVNKGFGGSNSQQGALATDMGYLDFDYDLLIVSYGMNDSSTSVATPEATFKENLRMFVRHRDQFRPNASILFCAPSSTDDPNRSAIANYRTWVNQVFEEYAGQRVYFADLSTAYSATDTADFFETTTPRVHPNASGHAKLHDVIYSAVQQTDFYQGNS